MHREELSGRCVVEVLPAEPMGLIDECATEAIRTLLNTSYGDGASRGNLARERLILVLSHRTVYSIDLGSDVSSAKSVTKDSQILATTGVARV